VVAGADHRFPELELGRANVSRVPDVVMESEAPAAVQTEGRHDTMTRFKLTYFDFNGGRGESIRIAFHIGGIDFEDVRLKGPDFREVQPSFRFHALPVLDIDGQQITQSNSILRYVGKAAGLYPTDDLQALYCDETMDAVEDLNHAVGRTFGLQGDAMKQAREELVKGRLATYIKGLGALLARGGGEYFADGRLTVADLKVFIETRNLAKGILDHVPTDLVENLVPALAAHRDRIANDPRVVAYSAHSV
jgi:glutathione S-transferase